VREGETTRTELISRDILVRGRIMRGGRPVAPRAPGASTLISTELETSRAQPS
jgi:hypothetical protein